MKQIASLKKELVDGIPVFHLFVCEEPKSTSSPVGSLSADVVAQLTGKERGGWVELFYPVASRPGKPGKIVRGWSYAKYLDIKPDPAFYKETQFHPPPLEYPPPVEIPTIVDPKPKFRDTWDFSLSTLVLVALIGLPGVAIWILYKIFWAAFG